MIVMAGMSYTANSRFLVQEVKESVRDLASIAASQVDGDVFATIEEGGEESEAYQQIFDQLSPFLNGDMVEYIYSLSCHNCRDLSCCGNNTCYFPCQNIKAKTASGERETVDDTMHDAKGKITSISDYLQKMRAGIDFYRGYIKNSFANPYAGIKCQYRSGTCR